MISKLDYKMSKIINSKLRRVNFWEGTRLNLSGQAAKYKEFVSDLV